MLKKIGVLFMVLVAASFGLVWIQPGGYEVERNKVVEAPPVETFGLVSDFAKYNEWQPWGKQDPKVATKVSGTPGTVGHGYEWKGNEKVGEGSMQILKVDAPKHVTMDLKFKKPYESTAQVDYHLEPVGENTKVSWKVSGQKSFAEKLMFLFVDVEGMMGRDLDRGLESLNMKAKELVQAKAAPQAEPADAPAE